MKNLSSPSPTKSSGISRSCSSLDLQQRFCSPKRSREANENEQESQNHPSLKPQKPKKLVGTKHFMSPTVSAASKAVVPRKKILAERNEVASGVISSDTQVHVTPIHDPNDAPEDLGFDGPSVRSSQTTPLSSRVSEPEANLPDPLAQPYDPFTNFLSPRPKFLRYNPSRRMEILHRRENELRKKGDQSLGINPIASSHESQKLVEEVGLSQVDDSLSSSLGDSSTKQEDSSPNSDESSPRPTSDEENNEGKDCGEDKVEEVREEKPLAEANDSSASSLGGGSSPRSGEIEPRLIGSAETDEFEEENEEDATEVEEEEEEEEWKWCFKDFLRWLKWLFLFVIFFITISNLFPMNSSIATPSQALWDLKEGYQKLQGQVSQAAMNDFIASDIFLNLEQEKEPSFMEADVSVIDEETENEEKKPRDISHQIDEIMDLLEGITAEVSNSFHVSQTQIELQYMDDMDMVSRKKSTETEVNSDQEKNVETLAVELTSEMYQVTGDAVQSEYPEAVSWNLEGPQAELTSNSYQVIDEVTELERPEAASSELNQVPVESTANEWTEKEGMVGDELEKAVDATNANGIDETSSPKNREIGETYESESSKLPVNEFAFNKIDTPIIRFENHSSELEVLGSESMRAHSISMVAMMGISFLTIIAVSTALQFLHLKRKKPFTKESPPMTQRSPGSKVVELKNLSIPKKVYGIEKAESSANPSSLVHLEGKDFEGPNQTQTPMVELLGEYVVGQFNSSLKRHNMESSPIESEASSFSWSQEKRPRRKGTANANHEYSTISDFSAVQSQSPSYGSFTTQEKIVMKEEGKVVTTPVRRSSRLANRTVMSP